VKAFVALPRFGSEATIMTDPLPVEQRHERAGLKLCEHILRNGICAVDFYQAFARFEHEMLQALSLREQGPPCPNCGKPVEVGQVVLPRDDAGEMHVDCAHPFALRYEPSPDEPAPVVLLGEPMRYVPLAHLQSLSSAREEERREGQAEGFAAAIAQLREYSARKPKGSLWYAAEVLAGQLENSRIAQSAIRSSGEKA
jgi:hypothetical protein